MGTITALEIDRLGPGAAVDVEALVHRAMIGVAALAELCTRLGAVAGGVTDATPVAAVAAEPDYVLRREGEYWAVRFCGPLLRVRDRKGMARLARLLAEPGREFHAMDLAGCLGMPRFVGREDLAHLCSTATDAGPLLDDRAKQLYRERLASLRDDLAEAEAFGDIERAAGARRELDAISGQLAAAVGLGGRDRRAASNAERARVSVTRTIREAVGRIGDQDAALGTHLDRSVRTGMFCSYAPERPITWKVVLEPV